MHQSFVATAPFLRGWAGDSGANVRGSDLLSFPQCLISAGLVILCKYIPIEFSIIKSGAITLSRSPQCRAFSRAVMDEKSLSPSFPIGGGGAVVKMTGA